MSKRELTIDLLIAVLLALIVVAEMHLAIKICQVDAETERVEAVMSEAQERIDAYYASLPALERPVVVSAAPAEPVVTAAPVTEDPKTPEWYIEDIPLAPELQKALWDACKEFEIDYRLALAVIEQETRYQNLIGDDGDAIGYFQVQPYWWGDLIEQISVDDLTDPVQNFRAGCAILRYLLDINDGNVDDALSAYNPGYRGYAEEVTGRWESLETGEEIMHKAGVAFP